MPFAAGKMCLVPAHTLERPDVHKMSRKMRWSTAPTLRRSRSRLLDNEVNIDEIEDSDDITTGRRGGAHATSNFRRTSNRWRARRRRAAKAMPPSNCRRPGCRSSNRTPLCQCNSQTLGVLANLDKGRGGSGADLLLVSAI